jgi:hypothetical protein
MKVAGSEVPAFAWSALCRYVELTKHVPQGTQRPSPAML